MSNRLSKIRSVHTYAIQYTPDGLFWLSLYLEKSSFKATLKAHEMAQSL